MILINDKFFLGFIAGFLGNIIENVFNYLAFTLHFSKHHIWHIAASAYFPIDKTKDYTAVIVGMYTDYIIGCSAGVLIVFLLYYTSTKYYVLKGIAITSFFWLFIFGIILRSKVGRIDPIDSGTNLTNMFGHIFLGIAISFFIIKLDKKANLLPK